MSIRLNPSLRLLRMTALELAQQLKAKFAGLISEPVEFRGEVTLKVSDAERTAVQLRGHRLNASVTLLKAAGGDWRPPSS